MFIGEYQHSVDVKGRLIVPAKFREKLDTAFILTRGLDHCLYGYPIDEWQRLAHNMKSLSLTQKDARAFMRLLFSSATEVELDKQGRIHIPTSLLKFAEIDKQCTIIGVSSKIEIWSAKNWEQYVQQSSEDFETIAENLMDFHF